MLSMHDADMCIEGRTSHRSQWCTQLSISRVVMLLRCQKEIHLSAAHTIISWNRHHALKPVIHATSDSAWHSVRLTMASRRVWCRVISGRYRVICGPQLRRRLKFVGVWVGKLCSDAMWDTVCFEAYNAKFSLPYEDILNWLLHILAIVSIHKQHVAYISQDLVLEESAAQLTEANRP